VSLHHTLVAVLVVTAAASVPSAVLACDECEGKKNKSQWQAVSTQVIQASPEQVMAVITDFNQWPEWTAWSYERDPDGEWSFEGQPGTVGYGMTWDGKELGKGSMELTEIRSDGLDFDLFFGRSKKANKGSFSLAEADDGTVVTWTSSGPLGLVGRLFRRSIEEAVSADFAVGLTSLEERVEASVAVDEPQEMIPTW